MYVLFSIISEFQSMETMQRVILSWFLPLCSQLSLSLYIESELLYVCATTWLQHCDGLAAPSTDTPFASLLYFWQISLITI